jgi:hypothetical protein
VKGRIALLLISLFLACGLGEFAMRRHLEAQDVARGELPWDTPAWVPPWMEAREATLRWRYSSEGDHNSLGLRDDEVGPKPEGTHRILWLGDSVLYFSETNSNRRFPDIVGARLTARFAERHR